MDQLRGGPDPASICCVLYSVSASPFRSLTLLMQTTVLLSLFSFVVKFGLMVQITDLWQFLLFLFPLLTTMQLLKLQWPKFAGLWGSLSSLWARLSPSPTHRCTTMRPFSMTI